MKRLVIWFSCGVTSAVAAKIAYDKYKDGGSPIAICTTDTGSEDSDNWRFMRDVAEWIGTPIYRLKNTTQQRFYNHYIKDRYGINVYRRGVSILRYMSTYDIYLKDKYLVGVEGARCSLVLKKKVRQDFEDLRGDLQVFGFDAREREKKRAKKFTKNNPLVNSWFPLIENGLSKTDCRQILATAGITEPRTYKSEFNNANCLQAGCVKGAMGYWNHIREYDKKMFNTMAMIERRLERSICKKQEGGVSYRVFLDELDPSDGNHRAEPTIQCSLFCDINSTTT